MSPRAKAAAEHPAVRQVASLITHLLARSGELIPGPASELVHEMWELEPSPDGTRQLRVTTSVGGEPVTVDIALGFTVTAGEPDM
ncbi:hypothetical protein HUT18_11780 [Streptomyces sp. NA04227]|uniref:hypothetical protein n=1 Tax=Streptomyces sp. NA04227 TaxID=2742136 RepID=UPI00159011C8|nr:hypothetical protein [Streptomyces sp. NA04227]QKW06978.1 hypothetical protein HUT18_11780 [Streptomyces sp. NA04227]